MKNFLEENQLYLSKVKYASLAVLIGNSLCVIGIVSSFMGLWSLLGNIFQTIMLVIVIGSLLVLLLSVLYLLKFAKSFEQIKFRCVTKVLALTILYLWGLSYPSLLVLVFIGQR